MESKQTNKLESITKKDQTHRCRGQIIGYQLWEEKRRAKKGVRVLRDVKVLVAQLCLTLCNPMDCSLPGSSVHGIFQGKNTGVSWHFLLQGIFPNLRSNPHLLCLPELAARFFTTGNTWMGSVAIPILSPEDVLDSGIELGSPAFQADSVPSEPPKKLKLLCTK